MRRSGHHSHKRLNDFYDRRMLHPAHSAFFGHSDHYNYGYTSPETHSQREASDNLVTQLLDLLPRKAGNILDVACGLGAGTRRLLDDFDPTTITGINISDTQLTRARRNAPGVCFLNMDATCLAFRDASFDNILCVESAFHFETREDFLSEALRILKPGGWLVLSDILGWRSKDRHGNLIDGTETYGRLLASAGFAEPRVIDATQECTRACAHRLCRWPAEEWRAGRSGLREFVGAWIVVQAYALQMRISRRCYLLAAAQKPA